jgi:MFS family permease
VIALELNGTSVEAFWSGTSSLLASAVVQPTFTSLSQVFGRTPVMLAALVFFTAGSIMCGTAHAFPLFLAGRSFQGIGSGGIMTLTYGMCPDAKVTK